MNKFRSYTLPSCGAERPLYFGELGALAWKNIELGHDYSAQRNQQKVTKKIITMLLGRVKNHATIISFGPGVGSTEMKLISALSPKMPKRFVPIDVNPHLLVLAATRVNKADPAASVPFTICGDFEGDIDNIGKILKKKLRGHHLFVMLGGTFGNVELGESEFLGGLKKCMVAGDLFLLDTFVKKGARYFIQADSFSNVAKYSKSMKKFLLTGLRQKYGNVRGNIEDLLDTVKGISSDVPQTSGFSFVFKNDSSKTLLSVRRYNFEALKKFLGAKLSFRILDCANVPTSNSAVSRGLFLLQSL